MSKSTNPTLAHKAIDMVAEQALIHLRDAIDELDQTLVLCEEAKGEVTDAPLLALIKELEGQVAYQASALARNRCELSDALRAYGLYEKAMGFVGQDGAESVKITHT